MSSETPAAMLKRVRKALSLSQGKFAAQFNVSQSQVSRWEAGEDMTPNVLEWLKKKANSLGEPPGDTTVGTASLLYSYPTSTFRRLWDESSKRMEHLHAQADIRPSTSNPDYADAILTLTFQGLRVPRGDSLYLDCLGVLPKLSPVIIKDEKFLQVKESEASRLTLKDVKARRAKVKEIKEVRELIGPHAIGYELSQVDEADEVSVVIEAERGVRVKGIDAIGAPVYADCVVASLSVSITFFGLKPGTPPPPKAEVYLLRRTLVESRPLDLAGDLEHRVSDIHDGTFSFERLIYPKAGYGYCIAWDTLKAVDK
jgi:transcriptional regulator with XRE-family HTH domain